MKTWNELMDERGTRTDKPMKPQVVTYHLNKLLADDAIVISDSGTIATWAARYIEIRGDMHVLALRACWRRWRTACPTAIGAAVAYPGRQVVCVVGDGGFTHADGRDGDAVKYKLPVKVIVIKNNVLGQIKWEQMVIEGNPEFGVRAAADRLRLPRAGLRRRRLYSRRPGQCESVLRQAFAQPGPVVVEAVVDPNEPPLPGNITVEQSIHFAEALAKDEKNRWKVLKTLAENKVREVV